MRAITLTTLALSALLSVGCQNKVAEENRNLWNQNRELQAQLDATRQQLQTAPNPSDLATMRSELQQRDAEIARLREQVAAPPAEQKQDPLLAGIETTYDPAAGTVTVNIPGEVLFAPGQSDLKPSAHPTLNRIIDAVKKNYPGKRVSVEGHTDTDPIVKTKDKYRDNYHLSYERADAVRQYLHKQGLDDKLLSIHAWGPTKPEGDKAKSRRVEIVVFTR